MAKKSAKKATKKRSDFASAKAYKAYKNRSAAQKKVWKERKFIKLRADIALLDSTPIRGLKKRPKPPPLPPGLSIEDLHWRLLEAEARLAMEILTRGFVDDAEVEMLHKDMTRAMKPSRLRHMGAVTDEMEKMLKRANKKGQRALRKQARAYAEYFDVPLREVYTLFFSP